MVRLRQSLLLLAANLLIPVGILIFMTGYFRGRPRMLTPAGVDMGEPERATSKPAPFDKVVFMIVDSLRRSEPLGLVGAIAPLMPFAYLPCSPHGALPLRIINSKPITNISPQRLRVRGKYWLYFHTEVCKHS